MLNLNIVLIVLSTLCVAAAIVMTLLRAFYFRREARELQLAKREAARLMGEMANSFAGVQALVARAEGLNRDLGDAREEVKHTLTEAIKTLEGANQKMRAITDLWGGRRGGAFTFEGERNLVREYWLDRDNGLRVGGDYEYDDSEDFKRTQKDWANGHHISVSTLKRYLKKHVDLKPKGEPF